LLRLGDCKPKLGDHDSVAHYSLFEVIDLGVSAHPTRLGTEALYTLDKHAPVPGAVEEYEAAARGRCRQNRHMYGCARSSSAGAATLML
jgi:hypothetical protein